MGSRLLSLRKYKRICVDVQPISLKVVLFARGIDYNIILIWQVFQKRLPPEAVDLVCRFFQYSPNLRCTAVSLISPLFVLVLYSRLGCTIIKLFDVCYIMGAVGSLHSPLLWWIEGPKHPSSQWSPTASVV